MIDTKNINNKNKKLKELKSHHSKTKLYSVLNLYILSSILSIMTLREIK